MNTPATLLHIFLCCLLCGIALRHPEGDKADSDVHHAKDRRCRSTSSGRTSRAASKERAHAKQSRPRSPSRSRSAEDSSKTTSRAESAGHRSSGPTSSTIVFQPQRLVAPRWSRELKEGCFSAIAPMLKAVEPTESGPFYNFGRDAMRHTDRVLHREAIRILKAKEVSQKELQMELEWKQNASDDEEYTPSYKRTPTYFLRGSTDVPEAHPNFDPFVVDSKEKKAAMWFAAVNKDKVESDLVWPMFYAAHNFCQELRIGKGKNIKSDEKTYKLLTADEYAATLDGLGYRDDDKVRAKPIGYVSLWGIANKAVAFSLKDIGAGPLFEKYEKTFSFDNKSKITGPRFLLHKGKSPARAVNVVDFETNAIISRYNYTRYPWGFIKEDQRHPDLAYKLGRLHQKVYNGVDPQSGYGLNLPEVDAHIVTKNAFEAAKLTLLHIFEIRLPTRSELKHDKISENAERTGGQRKLSFAKLSDGYGEGKPGENVEDVILEADAAGKVPIKGFEACPQGS